MGDKELNWSEWRTMLCDEFVHMCKKARATDATLKGRERIQSLLLTDFLTELSEGAADGAGPVPHALNAAPRTQSPTGA